MTSKNSPPDGNPGSTYAPGHAHLDPVTRRAIDSPEGGELERAEEIGPERMPGTDARN